MKRSRLPSIFESSELKYSVTPDTNPYVELHIRTPEDSGPGGKSSQSLPKVSKLRRRSRSLGRFFRKTFCGSCRAPPRNFSNTSLEIPPYRGGTKERQLLSSPRHGSVWCPDRSDALSVGGSSIDSTQSVGPRTRHSMLKSYTEEAEALLREQGYKLNSPGPWTGAVPKTRSKSVPPRLEECKFCTRLCTGGKIVVDSTLIPRQKFKSVPEVPDTDFQEMISKLPTPLFRSGDCPACCQKCRAEAAGVPVNEETKSCCCRFNKAKCLLPYLDTALDSDFKRVMKEKNSAAVRNDLGNVDIKRPPSTPERKESGSPYNLSPLAEGLQYENVRQTTHGKAFTVSPTSAKGESDCSEEGAGHETSGPDEAGGGAGNVEKPKFERVI